MEYALRSSREAIRGFTSGPGSAWKRIEAYSTMVVRSLFDGDTSRYFIIVLQAMTQGKAIPGLSLLLSRTFRSYYEILVPVIAEAQRTGQAAAGDPEALAGAYFSFIQGLATIVLPAQRPREVDHTPDTRAHPVPDGYRQMSADGDLQPIHVTVIGASIAGL